MAAFQENRKVCLSIFLLSVYSSTLCIKNFHGKPAHTLRKVFHICDIWLLSLHECCALNTTYVYNLQEDVSVTVRHIFVAGFSCC